MLSEFDFEVIHKPGIDNEMDCLSRFPAESSLDTTGVRQEGELEGRCIWSAATCLAWMPSQSAPWEQASHAGGGQWAALGGVVSNRQPGAAALLQQTDAARGAGAGDQPGRQSGDSRLRAVRPVAGPASGSVGLGTQGTGPGPDGCNAGQDSLQVAAGPGVRVHGAVDVWEDGALMALLQGRGYPLGCGRAERDRLQHRAHQFLWQGGHLMRQLPDGTTRVVPRMAERGPLIRDVHERAGHFGVRKTQSLLRPHYWWVGLSADVAQVVKRCGACDRVKASFNAKHPTLQPLPIKGMFYRWGLDFAGPLPKSRQGNQCVLVMVEYFSKQVILVATADKEPATVAAAFTREVLTRFGACAEVVTDRGGEFGGEFQACLDAAFLDHRATSAYHPQANGLSERVVGVVKRSLRKWCLGHASEEWDVYLPWVAMGYNFSAQASLAGFSQYQLLFGKGPVVPGAIRVAQEEALDLDQPERLAALVAQQAELFRQWMPMAMGNLEIAQHRDTLRYAKTRSGAWKPRPVPYTVGDYVYLRREMLDTLDTRAGASILRVRAGAENGVLELEGSDARTVRVHMERCAPCHRPDVDGRMDPRTAVPPPDSACTRCRKASGAARMLLCDSCGAGWHLECLAKPLAAVPAGDWFCAQCVAAQAPLIEGSATL
jgi:hypothetical protein